MDDELKTGTKVWCKSLFRKLVVGQVLENGNVICIDIFTTTKEGNFKTYSINKDDIQIGWFTRYLK